MPYKFNGKELDQETGLYYYGARYMNPRTSLWYGVDPLAEKYPSVGGYVYCVENPIKYLDTDGRRIVIHYQDKNGNQRTYIFMGYRGKKKVFTSLMFSSSRILLQHITIMLVMVGEKILYLRQLVINMRYICMMVTVPLMVICQILKILEEMGRIL